MKIIAHRGNSWLAPQNTMAAFDAARRTGVHSIELDIQVLADGDAAIIHDDTVDATTDGTGRVDSFTAASIKDLDAGSWFSPSFSGEKVPLFSELLEFLSLPDAPNILLEVKDVWEREPLTRVLRAIETSGHADKFIVQSFEVDTVALAKEIAPDLTREWLINEWREDAVDVAYELGVVGVNPNGKILLTHPDFVDEMHGAGLHVSVWTLNEPEFWEGALMVGVDAVITDRPEKLAGWLAAKR